MSKETRIVETEMILKTLMEKPINSYSNELELRTRETNLYLAQVLQNQIEIMKTLINIQEQMPRCYPSMGEPG